MVDPRRAQAQERIARALKELPRPGERPFSPFTQKNDPADDLFRAASAGGLDGILAALDEFDRKLPVEGLRAMQHALLLFLTHYPDRASAGIRIPRLAERATWALEKKRENDDD